VNCGRYFRFAGATHLAVFLVADERDEALLVFQGRKAVVAYGLKKIDAFSTRFHPSND